MGDQSDWERVWASKNDKTAFWGYLIPLTVTLLLLLIPTYIGVFQKPVAAPGTEEEYLIYGFVFERLSPILALFITVTIISAIMSSADSFMIGSGQIFSNDIIKRFVNREASDKELIFWTRMGVVVSGTVGFAFAINISDMIYLWISGIAIATVTIIPAYFMAWFSKTANTRGVLWGMGAGMLYCALIYFYRAGHKPSNFFYCLPGHRMPFGSGGGQHLLLEREIQANKQHTQIGYT